MATSRPITIIADSSGLISLAVLDDSNHRAATAAVDHLPPDNVTVVVPAEVLAETLNILGKKIGHAHAVQLVTIILESQSFSVASSDAAARQQAITHFLNAPGTVSYTDCLVMAIADQLGTQEIFGFDEIFTKEGYRLPSAPKPQAA